LSARVSVRHAAVDDTDARKALTMLDRRRPIDDAVAEHPRPTFSGRSREPVATGRGRRVEGRGDPPVPHRTDRAPWGVVP
jgi:hypothetical protein